MIYCFDLFNTVFDVSGVDMHPYIETIRAPLWQPFVWAPEMESLPLLPGAAEGLQILRDAGHYCVAASNAPVPLVMRMSKNAGVLWDAVVPFAMEKTYKPNESAYRTIQKYLGDPEWEAGVGEGCPWCMVSRNRGFEQCEPLGITLHEVDSVLEFAIQKTGGVA